MIHGSGVIVASSAPKPALSYNAVDTSGLSSCLIRNLNIFKSKFRTGKPVRSRPVTAKDTVAINIERFAKSDPGKTLNP